MASMQEKVRIWLAKKPSLVEAVGQGVVNFSSLARLAQEDLGGSFEAVKKAVIRQAETVRAERRQRRQKVEALLRNSRFEISSGMAVVLTNDEPDLPVLAHTRTSHGWTSILRESEMPRKWLSVPLSNQVRTGQVLIALYSGMELEDTPFVLSYLLSAMEREGINITEFVSCREDTLFVVDEVDGPAAHRVLSGLIRG